VPFPRPAPILSAVEQSFASQLISDQESQAIYHNPILAHRFCKLHEGYPSFQLKVRYTPSSSSFYSPSFITHFCLVESRSRFPSKRLRQMLIEILKSDRLKISFGFRPSFCHIIELDIRIYMHSKLGI
jgi:hypothetical protein